MTVALGSASAATFSWLRRCRRIVEHMVNRPGPADVPLSPDDVTRMLINPFYAIQIDRTFAMPHKPLVSEQDWIAANVRLIDEMGPEKWLRVLLATLAMDESSGDAEAR